MQAHPCNHDKNTLSIDFLWTSDFLSVGLTMLTALQSKISCLEFSLIIYYNFKSSWVWQALRASLLITT